MLEGKSVLEVYQFDLLKERKKIMILRVISQKACILQENFPSYTYWTVYT